MTQVHAFKNDVLGQEDAVGISARIKRGACSVDEVLQASLQRLQQVDPQINASVAHNLEQARQRAQATAKNSLLYGVPTFISLAVKPRGLARGYKAAIRIPCLSWGVRIANIGLLCITLSEHADTTARKRFSHCKSRI